MKNSYSKLAVLALVICAGVVLCADQTPGVSPGAGIRYATDAYPGFDSESEIVSPSRKTPRLLSFLYGPDCASAEAQYAHCRELVARQEWGKAREQLDALVRAWPTAPEAAPAQRDLAEICLTRLNDAEEAFAEFRYLLDFYSLQCEYDKIADRLYQVAGILRREGKEVMFVRFENTVDVRRAYEACVLRAPGAKWVPEAMLTIADLRTREEKFDEAVKVYENLRNLHPDTEEAKIAVLRESEVRLLLLGDYGYNRLRCQDTVDFLKLALRICRDGDAASIQTMLDRVLALCEEEDYLGAKFYDSPTRTVRSAINAYEKYLADHPDGAHAETVRRRVEVLKGGAK